MAKLPSQRTVSRENIPDAPSWLGAFIAPLNSFMEAVYSALKGNLNFDENITSRYYEVSFFTASDYTSGGFTPLVFSKGFAGKKAKAVFLCQVYKTNDIFDVITDPVSVHWYENNDQIQVSYIAGLENSTQYSVRLLVI